MTSIAGSIHPELSLDMSLTGLEFAGGGVAAGGSKHRPEDASKDIADKLLQGWKLLAQHCPRWARPCVALSYMGGTAPLGSLLLSSGPADTCVHAACPGAVGHRTMEASEPPQPCEVHNCVLYAGA